MKDREWKKSELMSEFENDTDGCHVIYTIRSSIFAASVSMTESLALGDIERKLARMAGSHTRFETDIA